MQAAICGATRSAVAGALRPCGSGGAFGGGRSLLAAPSFSHHKLSGRHHTAAALSRRELLGSSAAAAVVLPPLTAQGATTGGTAGVATASAAAVAPAAGVQQRELTTEIDSYGVERLALQPEGWNSWGWRGQNVNWLSAGDSGPVVLLIHGFGASVYHWRYNVPQLSKHCRVYALDCLGFGWSSKPVVEYDGYELWTEQISDFIRDVIGGDERVVLVGNSLGGYNALETAARQPDLVRGVVLLNAAGRFDEDGAEEGAAVATEEQQSLWSRVAEQVTASVKRSVVFASFIFTKQPARIRQVLNQVYESPAHVDDDLVRSISLPAQDPNGPEVRLAWACWSFTASSPRAAKP